MYVYDCVFVCHIGSLCGDMGLMRKHQRSGGDSRKQCEWGRAPAKDLKGFSSVSVLREDRCQPTHMFPVEIRNIPLFPNPL